MHRNSRIRVARSAAAGLAVAIAIGTYGLLTGTLPVSVENLVSGPGVTLVYGLLMLPIPVSMGAIAVLAADEGLFSPVLILLAGVVLLPVVLVPETDTLLLWLLIGLSVQILGLGLEYGVRRALGVSSRLLRKDTERAVAVGSLLGLVWALWYRFGLRSVPAAYPSPAASPLLEFGYALYSLTGLVALAGLPVVTTLRYRAVTPLVLAAGYGYLVTATQLTGPGVPAGEPDVVVLLWPGLAFLYLAAASLELGVRRRLRSLGPF
jgi:hypothetical protein